MPQADVVVVGAGAAGLSAAAALQRRGVDAVLLERDAALGGTWARRYERLHLHTTRAHSGLAHYPIPRGAAKYLSRDAYVAYLNEYALHFGLRIVTGQTVQKIHRDARAPDQWLVRCPHDSWQARVVVIASGQYRVPLTPVLPGLQTYCGQLTHSAAYQNGKDYVGKRVLVVGAGNSGAEIATDLVDSGAAFVALSVRSAPPIVPRDPFGTPVQRTSMLLSLLPTRLADRLGQCTARLVLGDLSRYGWPAVDWRPYSSRRVPVIDVGFVSMLKNGRVDIRPALASLTATTCVTAA